MEKEAERGISIEGSRRNAKDTDTERRMETIQEEYRGNEINTETEIETEIDKEAEREIKTDAAAEKGDAIGTDSAIKNTGIETDRRMNTDIFLCKDTGDGMDMYEFVESDEDTIDSIVVSSIDTITGPDTRTTGGKGESESTGIGTHTDIGRYTQLSVLGLEHITMPISSQAPLPDVQ